MYVAANFQGQDWFEKLAEAGVDPAGTAFFLWEAVTMYLHRRRRRGNAPTDRPDGPCSVIAFDYFDAGVIASSAPYMRYLRETAKVRGRADHVWD